MLDLKDTYFQIQIAPHQRRFLRFAFEGLAYQYTVLPFGLSLAPRTFATLCDGKPPFGPWLKEGRLPSHQLPENTVSMVGHSDLSARPEGTSRLILFVQYDGGVLHKSPGRSFLEATLYPSRVPLEVGSGQLALAESSAHAGQIEHGSRHAISEQCPLRRVDAISTNGSGNMGNL